MMPSSPNKDMARAKECTIAHRVVTDERTLGGWSSPRTTKQIPATRADNPAQRRRLDAVIFILLFSLRGLRSGQLRSRVCLLHTTHSGGWVMKEIGTARGPGPPRSRRAALPLRRGTTTTVRRDDGVPVDALQDAIIWVGRLGSKRTHLLLAPP